MATIFRGPLIFRTWHKQPWGVSVGSQTWVWQDTIPALLKGKDTFFRSAGYAPVYDYPNPTLPKDRRVAVNTTSEQQSDRLNNLLKGQDIIWGARGMAPDYDWTNPVWPRDRRVSLLAQSSVWQERNTGLYVGKDALPFSQDDWPNPTLPKDRRIAVEAQIAAMQNILVGTLYATTLSYIVTPPLIFRNWRTDHTAANRAEPDVWQNGLLNVLVGQDRLPNNQDDWPNPLRPGPRQSESRSDLLLTTLVGQDQLPVNQDDWPNPTRPLRVYPFDPLNLLISTLQFYPVLNFDWPNPTRAKELWGVALRSQDGVFRDSVITTLSGQDQLPNNEKDWPLPIRPGPRSGESKGDLLLTTLLGQDQLPFRQEEWPLPQRPGPRQSESRPDLLVSTLAGQDQLPEQESNWANPVRPKESWVAALRAEDSVWQDRLLNLLAGQDQLPFFQTNWPNPLRPGPRQAESKGDLLTTTLVGQDILPENQKDWPNPIAVRRPAGFDLPNLLASTLQVYPFANSDWPNPRPRASQQIFVPQNLLASTLATNPFVNLDGGVPRGVRNRVPPDFASVNLPLLAAATTVPFFVSDWQNPRRAGGNPALMMQSPGFGGIIPTPPVTADTPWSGFISNMGRMMTRRG